MSPDRLKENPAASQDEKLKRWESLTIKNRFIFAKVMSDPPNILPLLQMLFPDQPIDHIELLTAEHTVEPDPIAKGVRYDIYLKDQIGRAYTIEMQVEKYTYLPLRSRYYASLMDEDLLSHGQDYDQLADSVVIFICPFDLFGKGRHLYTFRNFCEQDPSLMLADKTRQIFLNTVGVMDDIPDNLRNFLEYVNGTPSADPYVRQLDRAVSKAKKNSLWRRQYMRWEVEMNHERNRARAKGLAEGRAEGRAKGLAEGRAEGLAEGLAEGRAEQMIETETERRRAEIAEKQLLEKDRLIAELRAQLAAK